MLLTPWAAADIATWQGPESSPDSAGMAPSNSTYDGFQIPSNSTITDSEFSLSPQWTIAADNGTSWSDNTPGGFSVGQTNGTSYLTSNGELTLSPNSTFGVMTDFETSTPQFSSWSSQGDEFWIPINLSNVAYGPSNATSGFTAAGTNGSITPGSQGFIRSQFWPIPDVVRYFNLSFDRWNSFDSGDVSELHYTIDNGQNWQLLDNWSGVTSDWVRENYSLDSLIQNATSIGFRYFVSTSNNSSSDVGLFIDSFNLTNEGEPLAAWFHGNASGQYSMNADGTLIVPVDLSGLTAPLEFTYWANWDIQGSNFDNLVVMISQDNGSSWAIMSPLPGVPGQGISSGTATFTQQSFGWRELLHPFPPWAAGGTNASNTLLKFRVTTDNSVNYGGSAIDGWEGIMIDDLRVISAAGSPNMQSRLLSNFTSNFTSNSSQRLVSVPGYANDWQHVDWEGHNGPWSTFDSFEVVQGLPLGWRIDHVRGSTSWERGQIDNSNGFGPNSTSWPSGVNGMAINLDGDYTNNVYSHLVSPIYNIPIGATARLTFNHWICSEPAWEGGSIFTSIDDGLTWQHFGDNLSGFYERVSQVNTNSPFFGHGIFDGSTVANGCGTANSNQTFSRVSGDISDLAGNDVRIRFSFFSDPYVEEDGWYLDDAGIVIDRFQSNGTWISPTINADDSGWARLTSLYEIPEGTNVTVDVLDINDNVVEGHENMTLPFDLNIAAWEYPQLKFRLELSTDNETLTPRIRILHHGITEYFTLELLQKMDPNLPEWVADPSLAPSPNLEYTRIIFLPSWRPFSDVSIECVGNISAKMNTIPNRVPVLSAGYPQFAGAQSNLIDEKECGEKLGNPFGPAQATTLELRIVAGEQFEWIKIEPITLLAPISPSIDLGDDGIIDWKWDGIFHHSTELYSLEIDGMPTSIVNSHGFKAGYTNSLNFSILLPARNLSEESWDCGINFHCYNGGLNFITNGSQYPQITESQLWINNSGFSHFMTEYKFSFTTNHLTNFNLFSINYISGFNHSIFINSSLIELFVPNSDTTSTLPVTISAQRGGVFFDGELTHERTIEDSWISLPSQTFRPGYIQTAVSNHQILTNSSALDYVTLKISSSSNIADTIAEVTIDNLVNGGRFIQNSGAGVLSLDTYNCSWDGENVVWSLESKWLLDDNSRLFWFASATNLDGITLGPAMGTSGSAQHAASTNDLEVIAFKAWSNNRSLHDLGNPLWPLNIMGDNEITIEGEVRYSGLNGVNPKPQDVDVKIELFDGEEMIDYVDTNIGVDGKFNTSLISPNIASLSGTELKIIPRLENIGNPQSSSAVDATSTFQNVLFVLDANNSEIVSLEINAPGGNQPADGHIWHPGQDIPLQLHVEDDNGLPSKMELFYNRSGRGWESIEFLTPVGATSAIIDLPLIDESSVPLPTEDNGWLDVYIHGFDLAGNPLSGGGDFDNPYATIYVQPRYDTVIEGDSIGLDLVGDQLLPGNTHRFNFTISDGNGIDSIDKIQVVLSKHQDICSIEWTPWNNEIIHDSGCFIKTPVVQTIQHWQVNTWDVYFDFELRWDLGEDIEDQENIPSLRLWDENAPLPALQSIDHYSWTIHSGIDLRIVNVEDKIAPLGGFIDDIIYIHAQDIVDVDIVAYHMGYDIPAHNLPFSSSYLVELIGNNGSSQFTNSFNSDGSSSNRIVFDSSYFGTQIKLLVNMITITGHSDTGDSIDIITDDSLPIITVSSGHLVSIDSDELDSVPVEVTMVDAHGLDEQPLIMHWKYIRQGRIVEGTSGTAEIPVQFQSVRSNLYSSIIDLNTSIGLQKGDTIMIWFDGQDASGRQITGLGASDVNPINTIIRWIAYEPVLDEIVTAPYRPSVGDIILIDCKIKNIGLLDGISNITLYDGNDRVIQRLNFTLLVNMEYVHTFEIEAWGEGDLGLYIQIDGQEQIPVPIANVETRVDESSNSQTTLLGLALLSVFIAGMLLVIANSRRNNMEGYDEEE